MMSVTTTGSQHVTVSCSGRRQPGDNHRRTAACSESLSEWATYKQ